MKQNTNLGDALVLAIHGSASSGRQWKTLAKLLEGKCHVLAPDMPGYGTMPDQDRRAFFSKLICGANGAIDIGAHSFGCSAAVYLANRLPQCVRSVTLYDPVVPVGEGSGNLAPDLAALWSQVEQAGDEDAMAMFIDYWTAAKSWQTLDEQHQRGLIGQLPTVKRDFSEGAGGYWSVRERRYQGPLSIFKGQRSPVAIREASAFLADSYAGACVVTVPDLGHMAPLTQSHVTDQLFKDCLEAVQRPPLLAA